MTLTMAETILKDAVRRNEERTLKRHIVAYTPPAYLLPHEERTLKRHVALTPHNPHSNPNST